MTNAWLAEFDAIARDAFADVGLAEKPTDVSYTPAGSSTPIPCAVLIDRDVIIVGTESGVATPEILVTAWRSDIGPDDPLAGATFLVGGTELLTVDRVLRADESRVVLVVAEGE